MLLDQFLPRHDFHEIHQITVKATTERTFAALKALTPAELSPLVGILLSLRDLPSRITGHASQTLKKTEPFLDQLLKGNFTLLADESDEVVFGLIIDAPGTVCPFAPADLVIASCFDSSGRERQFNSHGT